MNQQQRQMLINTLAALRTMAQDKKRTLLSLRSEHSVMYRQARQTFSVRECNDDELDKYLWVGVTRFCRRAVLLNEIEERLTYARQQQTEAARKVQDTVLTIDSAFNASSLPEGLLAKKEESTARNTAENVYIAATNAAHAGYPLAFILSGLYGDVGILQETDEAYMYQMLVTVFDTAAETMAGAE